MTRMLPGLPLTCALLLWMVLSILLPLNDYDYFWHLELGRWMLEHGLRLPTQDPFSYTAGALPHVYRVQGWLFDVAQYRVVSLGGDLAMRLFVGAILTLTWSIVYRTVRLIGTSEFHALLLTGLGVIVAWRFFTPRPTAVTFLGFALVCYLVLRHRLTGRSGALLWLPLIFCCWANLHPGYLAGLAVLVLAAVCAMLDRWMPVAAGDRVRAQWSPLLWLLLILASVAALAINPYGASLIPETFGKAATDSASVVNEWQSPDFKLPFARLFLALLLAWIVTLFFATGRGTWFDLLLPLALSAMALQSLRHILLASIALVIGLAGNLARCKLPWIEWNRFLPAIARRKAVSTAGSTWAAGWIHLTLIAAMAVGLTGAWPAIERRQQAFQEHKLPVRAVAFIREQGLTGPLFNDYHLGGYLIQTLGAQAPVFIDGRYNPFVGRVLDDYLTIRQLKQGWRARLRHYGIRLLMLEQAQDGLGEALIESGEFRAVYADERFAVLIHSDAGRDDLPSVPWVVRSD